MSFDEILDFSFYNISNTQRSKVFSLFLALCEKVRIAPDASYIVVNCVRSYKLVALYIPIFWVLLRGIVYPIHRVM